MDIIDDLLKEKEEREKIFSNYKEFVKQIKELAKRYFGSAKVYVFGSAVRGDYHVILSDIDVAVITNCEDNEVIYRFKAEVSRNFGDVFEVHILNERLWNFYKRFIDTFEEI